MFTGLSVNEAVERLKKQGITNYKVICLRNDKQHNCDKEVVLSIRMDTKTEKRKVHSETALTLTERGIDTFSQGTSVTILTTMFLDGGIK